MLKNCLALFLGVIVSIPAYAADYTVGTQHRSEANQARDIYRNPAETLKFFELKPSDTVVEIWPGGGWYSEWLAPLLADRGQLIAAHFSPDAEVPYFRRSLAAYQEKLKQPIYNQVKLSVLQPPEHLNIADAGSADKVLTFRNVHNWMRGGDEQAVFNAFYKALKPGGILGVVEHRAPLLASRDEMVSSGYVSEPYVIALAEMAGFELVGRSEINANPKDTKDYAKGVWTLPPSLRLGDTDRERYIAIGESDRMTLKFKKPLASK